MEYSISELATKAECDLVLAALVKKRDEVANHGSNLAFQLQNFGSPAERAAELLRLNRRITEAQQELLTLPEGKEKRDTENAMVSHIRRRNQLLGQAETQGSDDKVLTQFGQASDTLIHDEAVRLIGLVQAHRDTLSE